MSRSMSYSRYFSTATTHATGIPAAAVSTTTTATKPPNQPCRGKIPTGLA